MGFIAEEEALGVDGSSTTTKPGVLAGKFISEEEATGIAPRVNPLDAVRTKALGGLDQMGQEVKAATNMLVGMPGGIAGVAMDAGSRISSLVMGEDAKTAGVRARNTSNWVNENWKKVTDTLGLSQDASGSKIDSLMNWAMEASDKGGKSLEEATKGVLSLETTQSVRDTLLNALGVKGLKGGIKPRGNATMEALTAEAPALTPSHVMLIEPPAPDALPPTKAELKAQQAAVDSLVVDKTKLKQIFGLAKKAGPEAEAALVQNIFDRALKPKSVVTVEPTLKAARDSGEVPVAVEPPRVNPLASAMEKKANGLLLDSTEAKAVREAGVEPSQITPLVNEALTNLREGKLITTEQAKAVRTLGVDVTRGEIKGFDGKTWFQRGKADPALLGVLGALGISALAAPHVVDWWNNSGGLSGDNARDVGPALSAAGAAGVLKGKGGMWHPETVRLLAENIFPYARSSVAMWENLSPDLMEPAELAAYHKAQVQQGWANRAVSNYLNKHAGTATDPIKDLRLPDGTKWEDLTDSGFSGTPASEYQAIPGMTKMAKKQRALAAGAKPDELIWEQNVLGTPLGAPPGPGIGVGRSHAIMKNYLFHVGDYIDSLNLTPEKLQQMDLPRAIRETVANDKRIAEMALRDVTKPNPTKIADTQALPLWKEYPAESSGPRKFSFNKDGSLQQLASVELPAGEVQYSWREIKLPESLTPEQMKRIRPMTAEEISSQNLEPAGQPYVALDEKGRPIKDNFSGRWAAGESHREAHLAGQLAQEGNSLGHCVGGYAENVLSGDSRIVSLRDQHGRSYATVELQSGKNSVLRPDQEHLRGDSIMQIKGPGNGAPADYVQPYVQDFVKSGKWGAVEDLHHTGLVQVGDAFHDRATLIKRAKAQELEATGRPMSDSDAAYIMDHPKEYSGMLSKLLKQTGKADTDLLIKIAGGAAAAAYLMSDAPKDDKLTLAAMGMAGTLGMKGRFEGVPEPKLVEIIRQGGKEAEYAAAKIYEDTHRQLQRSITQMGKDLPIEDIAQETYQRAFEALKDGEFRGDAKLSTYLHGIARNQAKDYLRRGRSRLQETSMEVDPETGATAAPEGHMMAQSPEKYTSAYDEAARGELGGKMQEALDKLSEDRRAALNAVEIEGLSYQEAAAELGIPENTVRSRVFRAKEDLQSSLRGYKDLQAGRIDNDLLIKAGVVGGGAIIGAAAATDPQRGAIIGGILGLAAAGLSTKPAAQALMRTTTRLGEIDPQIHRAIREMELAASKEVAAASEAITAFTKPIKAMPEAIQAAVERAYYSADASAMAEALKGDAAAVSGYRAVRNFLTKTEQSLKALGRFKEGLPDYLPLVVKDYKGLMESLGHEARSGIANMMHKANMQMLKKEGRELTNTERSMLLNDFMRNDPATSFQPGYGKARTLRVTPETQKFYMSLEEALIHYGHAAMQDVAAAEFFGKDLRNSGKPGHQYTNIDNSIGALTDRALREKRMTPEQAVEVQQMLRARFIKGAQSPSGWLQDIRNVTGAGLLSQVGSGLVQTSEGLLSVYHHNLVPALQAAGILITRKGIKPGEFGLANHVIEEVIGSRASGKALSGLLKLNLLATLDQLGMSQNLTASFVKNKALAQTAKGQAKLMEKWGPDYGPDMPQLIQELQGSTTKARTPLVDSLLYQELSDVRPTSRAEATELFNAHPNTRMMYHLKQFMLTQADVEG